MANSKPEVELLETQENVAAYHTQNDTLVSSFKSGEVREANIPCYQLTVRTYTVLLCMGMAWGVCTMASIGPSTTYHYSIISVGGSSISSWIPNSALLPLIGLQPIWGTLADRFGKKSFIVVGGVIGVAGNVVAGTANSIEFIIIGQAVNGVASSLFLLVIPAGMEIVPASHRSLSQAIMGVVNGLMGILSLLVSGAFSTMSVDGWRWVYYFNAIFFGLSGLFILFLFQPPANPLLREKSTFEILRTIDFVGIVCLLCAVVGLVMGLVWGGRDYAWNSSRVISFITAGIALLIGFCIYETFGRRDGLVDHRFLECRNFLLILTIAFLDGMLMYGVNSFLPSEASALFTTSPILIGVYLIPLNVCILVGILLASYVLGVLKHYRVLLVLSVATIALFCGLLALITNDRLAMMLVFTGVIGLGVGITTVLPPVIITYAVPSHLIGTAGTLLASTRAIGGVTGITIFAVIEGNYAAAHLTSVITTAVTNFGLPASLAVDFSNSFVNGGQNSPTTIPGINSTILTTAQDVSMTVAAQAFSYVWITNSAIAIVAMIFSLFLQDVKHKMTGHVEIPLEGRLKPNSGIKSWRSAR
ncbi:major facilitator superfamily domain-containing protein [Camillea tinctor]|nr:major facilitator superfamily domain-containing protein [Camillea tinctor]